MSLIPNVREPMRSVAPRTLRFTEPVVASFQYRRTVASSSASPDWGAGLPGSGVGAGSGAVMDAFGWGCGLPPEPSASRVRSYGRTLTPHESEDISGHQPDIVSGLDHPPARRSEPGELVPIPAEAVHGFGQGPAVPDGD